LGYVLHDIPKSWDLTRLRQEASRFWQTFPIAPIPQFRATTPEARLPNAAQAIAGQWVSEFGSLVPDNRHIPGGWQNRKKTPLRYNPQPTPIVRHRFNPATVRLSIGDY
jgi:hypothetical protein